jgi:hypothetical protein
MIPPVSLMRRTAGIASCCDPKMLLRCSLEADPERERSELSKLFNDDEPGRA